MFGVFLKEQKIKNSINLGLGGMLRELKMVIEKKMLLERMKTMTASGTTSNATEKQSK